MLIYLQKNNIKTLHICHSHMCNVFIFLILFRQPLGDCLFNWNSVQQQRRSESAGGCGLDGAGLAGVADATDVAADLLRLVDAVIELVDAQTDADREVLAARASMYLTYRSPALPSSSAASTAMAVIATRFLTVRFPILIGDNNISYAISGSSFTTFSLLIRSPSL